MNIVYQGVRPIMTEAFEWVSTNYLSVLIINIFILITSVILFFIVKSDKVRSVTVKCFTANLCIGTLVYLISHPDIAKSIIVWEF